MGKETCRTNKQHIPSPSHDNATGVGRAERRRGGGLAARRVSILIPVRGSRRVFTPAFIWGAWCFQHRHDLHTARCALNTGRMPAKGQHASSGHGGLPARERRYKMLARCACISARPQGDGARRSAVTSHRGAPMSMEASFGGLVSWNLTRAPAARERSAHERDFRARDGGARARSAHARVAR